MLGNKNNVNMRDESCDKSKGKSMHTKKHHHKALTISVRNLIFSDHLSRHVTHGHSELS